MPTNRWELHEANVQTMIYKMERIIHLLSEMTQAVSQLPNVTQEIITFTNEIKKDTADLHGMFHAN